MYAILHGYLAANILKTYELCAHFLDAFSAPQLKGGKHKDDGADGTQAVGMCASTYLDLGWVESRMRMPVHAIPRAAAANGVVFRTKERRITISFEDEIPDMLVWVCLVRDTMGRHI